MVTGKEAGKFLMTEKSKCDIYFLERHESGGPGDLINPIPLPGKGMVHIVVEYWTRCLPTNILIILLSENGTLISDFHLFISAKALFCMPSCVLLNVT